VSIKNQYRQERDQLQMFLGEIGALLERESGFVQRQSKFGGNALIQTMTLGCLENGSASLENLCQIASDLGISISAAGLHQRLNTEAVELLRKVCQIWMQQKIATAHPPEVLQFFGAVRIIDSSRIALPGSLAEVFPGSRNGATMKVQLAYEYHQGQVEALEIEGERSPDQKCRLPQELSQAGDLVLFDLGYFDQNRFAELDEKGVYFISRLQSQTGLYERDHPEQKVNLLETLNQLPADISWGECTLRLGRKQKVPLRVVYYRVPSDIAQQRRRKAKQAARKRGQTCSQNLLDWQDWLIFVTNVPLPVLHTEQVAVVYRVRWQIEILFKVWKQDMDWGIMKNWRLERILCQFYARCLALLLFHHLIVRYHNERDWELSWSKALQRLKHYVLIITNIVRHQFRGLLAFLKRLDSDFRRFARKSQRRKSPSTYTLLKHAHA